MQEAVSAVCPHNYWEELDEYLADPCCSRDLSYSQCCRESERSYQVSKYSPNSSQLESLCSNAECLKPAAKGLASLQSLRSDSSRGDECFVPVQKVLYPLFYVYI